MSLREINFKIFRTVFFLLLIGVCQSSLLAQAGKIAGKITDAATGEPLPGVNVLIVELSTGAATDLEGDYFILNVPPGTYSLRVSTIGYTTILKTNVEVSINHTTNSDFEMQETVIDIGEDIVITADRPPVELDETSTRHFVSADEIAARPATELSGILNTLPGIDQNAAGELTVRRGSLDQVAFLIDGMRASNPLNYDPYTNINLSSIQELEVITGGFNAEYGQAQSGVFNIVTKDGTQNFTTYNEFRWTPPRQPHWGTAFYDYSTTRYWENTHARHLQWWIDNPDQWVDPNGTYGNDPNSLWSPEEAYADYMNTHQPLTDYTDQSRYQAELSFGGPTPVNDLFFFVTGKYRSMPPVTGNSFRERATWFDGTAKLTYRPSPDLKFIISGFYGEANSDQGTEYIDFDWVTGHGLENKYAYYDYPGYTENRSDGETIEMTHVLGQNTFYELQFSRIFRYVSTSTFPGDVNGWLEGTPEYDNLRAVDAFGNPIPGGYNNIVGLHTTGYYYRGSDNNSEYTLSGDLTTQINKSWQLKAGGDFSYYILDRRQEAKAFFAIEDEVYHPFEGNLYVQSKLEFEGLIMNLGLRYDVYNPNDKKYLDPFDPFDLYYSAREGREPNPRTEPTSTFSQLSPRIGISHPISENTVLHFSYGHFFQRANFGDYGEGTIIEGVTGILNTYRFVPVFGNPAPYVLGNRDLKPRRTVQYELGIEHNIGGVVADVTAFYKDITKTVRTVTVITRNGGRYLTSGNSNYGDAKGVEIQIRKPFSDNWGGYLNYTWSTGITGRSGDPDVIAPPGSGVQVGQVQNIGDYIEYDPARLKFGITVGTPESFGILSGIQFALDYQIYYPHDRIADDVISESGQSYTRPADINADLRIRKEFVFGSVRPAFFIEVHNLFNNKWVNLNIVKSASPEDRVKFINSGFTDFPETRNNGAPFPDVLKYRNLPREIIFGFAIGI